MKQLKKWKSLYEADEKDLEALQIEKDKEAKNVQKLIKQMKSSTATNKDARAEFAKNIFQLSLSSDPFAKTLIKKMILFIQYFGEDLYLDEDEWRKLNNTDKLDIED